MSATKTSPITAPDVTPYSLAFASAVAFVIDYLEGGAQYTDDAGGTRFGIAQNYNPEVDVKNLTRAGAEAVYRRKYWDAHRCGELPPPIGFLLFDLTVNPPACDPVELLQSELRVERDGVVGPDTIDAAKRAPRTELLVGLTAQRIAAYYAEVRKRPSKTANLNGWVRRSCRALVYAARLA